MRESGVGMRILVVEDDAPLATFVRKGLEAEHYAVDTASDGELARCMALESDYDLLILDLNLPKVDGIDVLRTIRVKKPGLPVLVLTARGRIEDRVLSLDTGADDCVIKPFSFTELSARVRALLRRGPRTIDTVLQVADLELDRVERKVKRSGKNIDLTSKEFALLEYLLRNAGRRVTRNMIIEHVWNLSFDTSTNIVDVYVNYLRRKVDDGFTPRLIHTVRGVGYELACRPEYPA
jgi:two-component system copper resistance phosphate regulon response regulator CusR